MSRVKSLKLNEEQFLKQVIGYAHLRRWKVAHFRPAQTVNGWRTPVQADGKGFPDLVCVRERVVWIETKVQPNKLSLEQEAWLVALESAEQEGWVFYPEDWDRLVKVLE